MNAVPLGHLDIERDEIGAELRDLWQPDAAVRRLSYYFDRRIGGEDVGDYATNQHRVVHNKNFCFSHGPDGVSHRIPRLRECPDGPQRPCLARAAWRTSRQVAG